MIVITNLYENKRDKPEDSLTSNNLEGMDIVLSNEFFLVNKLTRCNDLPIQIYHCHLFIGASSHLSTDHNDVSDDGVRDPS